MLSLVEQVPIDEDRIDIIYPYDWCEYILNKKQPAWGDLAELLYVLMCNKPDCMIFGNKPKKAIKLMCYECFNSSDLFDWNDDIEKDIDTILDDAYSTLDHTYYFLSVVQISYT